MDECVCTKKKNKFNSDIIVYNYILFMLIFLKCKFFMTVVIIMMKCQVLISIK